MKAWELNPKPRGEVVECPWVEARDLGLLRIPKRRVLLDKEEYVLTVFLKASFKDRIKTFP